MSFAIQYAAMAQLVEHVLGKDEVTGSNPVSSSKVKVPEFFDIIRVQALLFFLFKIDFSVKNGLKYHQTLWVANTFANSFGQKISPCIESVNTRAILINFFHLYFLRYCFHILGNLKQQN